MSTPAILLALANSPQVSNPSRSILSALLSHCADHTVLSNFLFVSLAQRIHALRAEGFRVLCACGCGEFVEPDPWEEQAEALNEEMSRWLADFVLIRPTRCAHEKDENLLNFPLMSYSDWEAQGVLEKARLVEQLVQRTRGHRGRWPHCGVDQDA